MVANFSADTKCVPTACLRLALSLAFFSVCAWPQTQLASVFGTVTDPSGAAIAGAQVLIVSLGTGLERKALTDTAGQYHFAGLPAGNYSVRVEKERFQTQVRQGVTLTSAFGVTLNVS